MLRDYYFKLKDKPAPKLEKIFFEYLERVTPKQAFLDIFKESIIDIWKEKGQRFEMEAEK